MKQKPLTIGLLLCEQVIVEEHTRNVTPVNCFAQRVVLGFPSEPLAFVAFAMLTDGQGDIPLSVRIERLDTLEEVFRATAHFHFENPLQVYRCILRIRNWSAPISGHYQVTLMAEHEDLAQRTMIVLQQEESA